MTQGFVSFGNGPPIPIGRVQIRRPHSDWKAEVEEAPLALPPGSDFTFKIPIPLLRTLGAPALADRFEIAAHPDLAELNVRMDGYYGGSNNRDPALGME